MALGSIDGTDRLAFIDDVIAGRLVRCMEVRHLLASFRKFYPSKGKASVGLRTHNGWVGDIQRRAKECDIITEEDECGSLTIRCDHFVGLAGL